MDKRVLDINSRIVSALKERIGKLIDAKVYGLAEPVMEFNSDGEKMIPAIYLPCGECINVFTETDMHDVLMYHKLQSISRRDRNGYGSRRTFDETAEMSIVVFGKRAFNQYQVERVIAEAIMQDEKCSVSASDFNAFQVYANEYTGQAFFLDTRYFLFKINYSITCTRNDGCVK